MFTTRKQMKAKIAYLEEENRFLAKENQKLVTQRDGFSAENTALRNQLKDSRGEANRVVSAKNDEIKSLTQALAEAKQTIIELKGKLTRKGCQPKKAEVKPVQKPKQITKVPKVKPSNPSTTKPVKE